MESLLRSELITQLKGSLFILPGVLHAPSREVPRGGSLLLGNDRPFALGSDGTSSAPSWDLGDLGDVHPCLWPHLGTRGLAGATSSISSGDGVPIPFCVAGWDVELPPHPPLHRSSNCPKSSGNGAGRCRELLPPARRRRWQRGEATGAAVPRS